MVHAVTVRPWNDGKHGNKEITVQLPARLTQKDKVMLVNTLVVFSGISTFVKDGVDMTYYQIKSLYGEPDSDTGDVERKSTSWVGIITLGDIDEGVLFMVISTSPYIVGEGENMREKILARVV